MRTRPNVFALSVPTGKFERTRGWARVPSRAQHRRWFCDHPRKATSADLGLRYRIPLAPPMTAAA